MFHINVVAPEFIGLNTVKQHRLINDVRLNLLYYKETVLGDSFNLFLHCRH